MVVLSYMPTIIVVMALEGIYNAQHQILFLLKLFQFGSFIAESIIIEMLMATELVAYSQGCHLIAYGDYMSLVVSVVPITSYERGVLLSP